MVARRTAARHSQLEAESMLDSTNVAIGRYAQMDVQSLPKLDAI